MSQQTAPLILTTIRFVWVDEILHVKEYRGLLNYYRYDDYEIFFAATARNVGFTYDPDQWQRLQVIVDSGWGLAKTTYDREYKGPVVIPDHSNSIVTMFNRTMLIPIYMRWGGEWKKTSSEVWLIPLDIETTVRQLKEYILTADFSISPENLLYQIRAERLRHFTLGKLQQALNTNNELSTFSLSVEYEGEPSEYPENSKLAINLFQMNPLNHRSPRIIFGMIPVTFWD
jgi:hypothetical protein